MKNTVIGILAATLLATPALAVSVKERFNQLDANQNNVLEKEEISAAPRCKTKFFSYVDKNRDGVLQYAEFVNERELLGRCK